MRWPALIFSVFFLTGNLDCSDLQLENFVPEVSSFFAEEVDARCSVVLHTDSKNLKEQNEIFKLAKHLAESGNFASASSFKVYLKFAWRLQQNRTCGNILGIVLGWQEGSAEKFSEFSRKIFMAQYKWLIFLTENMTTEDFLKEANTPFNSELFVAKVTKENVVFEEAYRVEKNYPLRISKYGVWENVRKKFVRLAKHEYLYMRRDDLEGIPLRASTRNDFPISRLQRNKKGDLFIEGYFGNVYYALADELNFTAVYVEAVENVTGIKVKNGRWTGLLGMVQRDEIDFVVGPVTFLRDVATVAGAVRPLLRSTYQIFFKQHGTVIKWSDILKPFEKYVWLCIVVWILIASYTLNQLYKLECRYGCEILDYQQEYNKTNLFLAFLKAFCQQGNPFVPLSNSCRILYITGYLVSVILVTAYSASLISNLTTQAPRRPFDSLETFLKDGSYTLIAIQGSTDYSYFSNANDTLRRDIFTKLMQDIPEEDLPTDKEEGVERVCLNTKLALFITFAVTQLTAEQYAVDTNCPILYFQTPLDTVFLTIARKKYLPYAGLIDYKLQNMAERGVLRRLQQQAWPLSRLKRPVNFKQVTIDQVFQIHFILLIGVLLSLILLIVEFRLDYNDYKLDCAGCIFCPRKMKWKMDIISISFIKSGETFQTIAFLSVGIFIVLFIVFVF